MENLIQQVISWAEDRNIVHGSDLEKETLKLVSKCGNLANYVAHDEVCTNAIGHCMIQMIIICRMRNINLNECIKSTKNISDQRVINSKFAALLLFKNLGQLAENISTNKNINADMGYLLIYLTAVITSLQLSMKECVEYSFIEIKDLQEIMFDGVLIDQKK